MAAFWSGILSLLFVLSSPGYAASDLLVDKLLTRGFTCTPQGAGHFCQINQVRSPQFSYSQPIAIYVPRNTRRPQNLVMHLHGFRCVCEACDRSAQQMMTGFDLPGQLERAGPTNSILITPISQGQGTQFNAELVPRFSQFMAWVDATVQPTAQQQWYLSGHSGAGSSIGTILGQAATRDPQSLAKIRGVSLLDATYSTGSTPLAQWRRAIEAQPSMKIFSVVQQGTTTVRGSSLLRTQVGAAATIETATTGHCQIPKSFFETGLRQIASPTAGSIRPSAVPAAQRAGSGR